MWSTIELSSSQYSDVGMVWLHSLPLFKFFLCIEAPVLWPKPIVHQTFVHNHEMHWNWWYGYGLIYPCTVWCAVNFSDFLNGTVCRRQMVCFFLYFVFLSTSINWLEARIMTKINPLWQTWCKHISGVIKNRYTLPKNYPVVNNCNYDQHTTNLCSGLIASS